MPSDKELMNRLGRTGLAFFGQFHGLREIQRRAVEPILAGQSVLLASATASGKTEALVAPMVARMEQMRGTQSGWIRILAIAPTRALVNDLFARLEGPLGRIGWSCGRQTSDHRDKEKRPHVLITTPESFDSMLVRNTEFMDGRVGGHLLARIQAVFIDEAHLFDGSSRGDQLIWLIGRLRRLRAYAERHGFANNAELQVCAASATVAQPSNLASRLLDPDGAALFVSGSRNIEILGESDERDWFSLAISMSGEEIQRQIICIGNVPLLSAIEKHIWRALTIGGERQCRKILVFVPTRELCDRLSTHLVDNLSRRRQIHVLAHHGSLDRSRRENAERIFSRERDAVLVATTTLEVGVDIGDVDAVCLVGSPPDTSALLQRIGRAGRQTGITRVIPIARNRLEACALGSMLSAARDGSLDSNPYTRRWSVFVQQVASFIAQAGQRGRRRTDIIELTNAVWPESDRQSTAVHILDSLIQDGYLVESRGRLTFGEEWANAQDQKESWLHHNLDMAGTGVPVVDASTGEIIARVQGNTTTAKSIALGGQRWDIVSERGEILLKVSSNKDIKDTFRYAARAAPTRRSLARHILLGLGFSENEAPAIELESRTMWLHCGGSAYEAVLIRLFSKLKSIRGLNGLAVWGMPDPDKLKTIILEKDRITDLVAYIADEIASTLSPGPYHNLLPEAIRKEVVIGLFGVDGFMEWLCSRRVRPLLPDDARHLLFRRMCN